MKKYVLFVILMITTVICFGYNQMTKKEITETRLKIIQINNLDSMGSINDGQILFVPLKVSGFPEGENEINFPVIVTKGETIESILSLKIPFVTEIEKYPYLLLQQQEVRFSQPTLTNSEMNIVGKNKTSLFKIIIVLFFFVIFFAILPFFSREWSKYVRAKIRKN